ncbi:MAG: molybdopterin molybdotransferase MoeA [Oxalicibacterium faecigallinarum]|uniref:molybdopterin molybdotransferase MoeA n=1 Tax=Oxalicibacterium faecigallinarum TaxID=573741 RepID=UPI002807BFB3|nr:gephyrin-like molybdotransferase Glp [Oxalicibacterium faecigallinarum]MDQ7968642.1 molybdopterin molybdotransferase MoeA [Oxalicibacterium faecigallinarum]
MNLRAAYLLNEKNLDDLDKELSSDSDATPASDNNTRLDDVVSCLSAHDPNAMRVEDAQAVIRQFVTPIHAVEKIAIRSALDRVLAADIISPINVPAHDNSAMDGYALRGIDLTAEDRPFRIIGVAYAGHAYDGPIGAGECVRIMTGAVMPKECDTVIPQELTRDASDSHITIPASAVRAGDNRRLAGEDLAAGSVALPKGRIVRPSDLGLMASLGVAEVAVQRRLRVAFFSTGDELRSVGEPLDEGCVYDSNRYTLYGMLKRLGCDIVDMGVIRDEPEAMKEAFRTACENADAIITSGGVSVGAADYTKQMMAELGDVQFWKLGMRPGRPMAFGRIHSEGKSAYLFGLPGNPVAVMVTFYFFARQALLHMMGATAEQALPLMKVRSAQPIRKRAGRTEFQRGILAVGADGQQEVRITGAQGSGILRSMSEANCIVALEHDRAEIKAGDMVDVILFHGLI